MRRAYLALAGLAFWGSAEPICAQSLDQAVARARGEIIANQYWDMHRQVTDFRWMTGPDMTRIVEQYERETEPYRRNAIEVADRARGAPLPVGTGARIRDALKADLEYWRNEVQVGNRDYRAMEKRWLVPVDSLDDRQWALQRANWYVARDKWLNLRVQAIANARP